MSENEIQAIDLELLELVDADWDVNTMHGSLVRPNCIRINGRDVLLPADSAIEFSASDSSVGVVRMSMFVRSLRFGHVRRDDRTELLGGRDAALKELFRGGTVINGEDCRPEPPKFAEGGVLPEGAELAPVSSDCPCAVVKPEPEA